MAGYELLLSPLPLGRVEVRNRVVSTAHGAFTDAWRPGDSVERYLAYCERRAAGGVGLMILQPVHVHPSSGSLGHHVPDPDDLGPKLRDLARAMHRHGTRVLVQLIHFGHEFSSEARSDLQPLWSFSGTTSPSSAEASHEMTDAEIEEVIDAFAAMAALAVEAGLDGVELQGAHGYLIQQSFSPWANRRTDRWGKQTAFVDALLPRVRAAIGDEPILGLRLSGDDFVPREQGGLGPEGIQEVARHVVAGGTLDYLNQSAGSRAAHYARAVASYRHPHGELLPLAAGLRRAIDAAVPVIAAGRITTPELAEQALRDGACDLVAMTRAQIADPDVVRKIASGAAHRIRPCVGANQGCVDRMEQALPITCFHNPDVGREHRQPPLAPVARPSTVVVVGGGPAGMKAAHVAAQRGHDVTLHEAGPQLGGRLLLAAEGAAAELLGAVRWLEAELALAGVRVQLRSRVDADALAAAAPDVVILATGARPQPDGALPGDGSVPVLATDDAMTADLRERTVVLVDHLGSHEPVAVAERLARTGARVTIVTPFPVFGRHLGFTHVRDVLRSLARLGVEIRTSTAASLAGGAVALRHVHSDRRERLPADVVVAAIAARPTLDLRAAAEEVAGRVLLAGDCVAPRTAMHAFREGSDAGRAA